MRTSEILELELTSLGINSITEWVKGFDTRHEDEIRRIKSLHGDDPEGLMASLDQCRGKYALTKLNNPRTVGDLVRIFPYSFTHSNVSELRKATISNFKKKLKVLGLKIDDWPALSQHGRFLDDLSKDVIRRIPIREIFRYRCSDNRLSNYLNCVVADLDDKTVNDFISIHPCNQRVACTLFDSHKQFFAEIREKLVKKGFSVKDGLFFKWDPNVDAHQKALSLLEKYRDLDEKNRRSFAKILVAERLVY